MALNLSFSPDLFSIHFPFLPSLHSKYIQISLSTSLILRKNLLKLRKHLNVTFLNLFYSSVWFLIGTWVFSLFRKKNISRSRKAFWGGWGFSLKCYANLWLDCRGWSPVLALFLARNILKMVMSSVGTREKVNKKISLQEYNVFCNLDSFSADIQTALRATHHYLSNHPWVGILGSNRIQRNNFILSWAFASFPRDVFLFLILK